MSDEEDAKEIVDFPLVPVCAVVEGRYAGNGRRLVGVRLDADARVVADTEEVVDHFKSVRAGGVVAACDARDLGELGGCVACVAALAGVKGTSCKCGLKYT